MTASKGTCTISIASPGVVTITTHGLATGDCIELTTTGALPTGLTANTNYYVIYVNANTFQLATTLANALAGTAIDTSGTQSGTHSLRYCPFGIDGATNFKLPDMQAASPQGAGTSTLFTENKTVVLGQVKNDQMQGHWHNLLFNATGSGADGGVDKWIYSPNTYLTNTKSSTVSITDAVTDGENGTPRIGTETTGKAIGMNYIIKW